MNKVPVSKGQLLQAFDLYFQLTKSRHFNDWLNQAVQSGLLEKSGDEYFKNTKVIGDRIEEIHSKLKNKNTEFN